MDGLLHGFNPEQLQKALDSMTPEEAAELCGLIETERARDCRQLRSLLRKWLDFGTQPACDAVPFNSLYVEPEERPAMAQGERGSASWWQEGPKGSGVAQQKFWWLFGRAPGPGEVLKFDHLEAEARLHLAEAEGFRELWLKYVSGADFPLKVEGDRIYVRHNQQNGWDEWQLDWMHDAQEQWRDIEREALGLGYGKHRPETVPSFPAVMFEENSTRPATKEEALSETEITGGLIGMLCSKNLPEDTAASC